MNNPIKLIAIFLTLASLSLQAGIVRGRAGNFLKFQRNGDGFFSTQECRTLGHLGECYAKDIIPRIYEEDLDTVITYLEYKDSLKIDTGVSITSSIFTSKVLGLAMANPVVGLIMAIATAITTNKLRSSDVLDFLRSVKKSLDSDTSIYFNRDTDDMLVLMILAMDQESYKQIDFDLLENPARTILNERKKPQALRTDTRMNYKNCEFESESGLNIDFCTMN